MFSIESRFRDEVETTPNLAEAEDGSAPDVDVDIDVDGSFAAPGDGRRATGDAFRRGAAACEQRRGWIQASESKAATDATRIHVSFPEPFYRWRPHPWHGLEVGPDPPSLVHAYIEITPHDSVKYEVDKVTGYLKVDRPQRYSSQPPALYGFVPRTYCGSRVDDLSPKSDRGDHDPVDICVLSERAIERSEIMLNAQVIGGLRMIDNGEADDKIIAVLENDNVWGAAQDISDVPEVLVERLRHYFLTYKSGPEEAMQPPDNIEVDTVYGRAHAESVIDASIKDYEEQYGGQ